LKASFITILFFIYTTVQTRRGYCSIWPDEKWKTAASLTWRLMAEKRRSAFC